VSLLVQPMPFVASWHNVALTGTLRIMNVIFGLVGRNCPLKGDRNVISSCVVASYSTVLEIVLCFSLMWSDKDVAQFQAQLQSSV